MLTPGVGPVGCFHAAAGGRATGPGTNLELVAPGRSIVSIGTFDGVHRGHAALLARARTLAAAHGARVVAMAFDPHPLTALSPAAAPARLTTWADRERLLRGLGADEVIRLRPEPATLGLSAEEFIRLVVADVRPAVLVEGPDFHFGRGRTGNVAWLAGFLPALGVGLEVLEPLTVALDDLLLAPASSTLTRWLLARGRVADAARVLGRWHTLAGTVVRGDRRGRGLGFPTANLATEVMLPGDGVYAARAVLEDGRAFAAAVHVGPRPTFGATARTVEAHVIVDGARADGAGTGSTWSPLPGLPEYGWGLRLELLAYVRDQAVFPGLEALRGQLSRDVRRAAEWFAHPPVLGAVGTVSAGEVTGVGAGSMEGIHA